MPHRCFAVILCCTHATAGGAAGPMYEMNKGVESMWQIPEGAHAILFVAHGCQHSATDFWDATASCPSCLGLPEERRITKMALAAGYAVVAVSSQDRDSRCWHHHHSAGDTPAVRETLAKFRAAHGLESVPLVAFGASSGGAFVLQAGATLGAAAVISQIMALPPSMLPEPMPPTLFVHMAKDRRTARYVHLCLQKLRGSSADESSRLVAHEVEVAPQRPTAAFFLARIDRLSEATATQLHSTLAGSGLLDEAGYLRDDPRQTAWRQALCASGGLCAALPGPLEGGPADSLEADASKVAEALNVAWAIHEIMSDPMEETLRWLGKVLALHSKGHAMGGGKGGMNGSTRRRSPRAPPRPGTAGNVEEL